MPNQRADGQILINVPMKESFVVKIKEGVVKSALGDRSKFIRRAIVEKLERLGIAVPPEIWSAPSREGKGGKSAKQPVGRRFYSKSAAVRLPDEASDKSNLHRLNEPVTGAKPTLGGVPKEIGDTAIAGAAVAQKKAKLRP